MTRDFAVQRQQMIASLRKAGIHDARVLGALAGVPREQFIDESLRHMAYADCALPINMGQTISQPLMVAVMTQALQLSGRERVLEIGTGSGYQTAILSRLAAHVYSVERYEFLAYQAAVHITRLGMHNVSIYVGDGSLGWPEQSPYDRILVTAAAPEVPSQLVVQLATDGMLVIPIGSQQKQDLQLIQRVSWGTRAQSLGGCVFVPLIGEEGWRE
ncbi:MAG TPA: protein-L-isoaspartate(D-aspartate) O-methyltransferase [Ktedonobacteraceae bacterium]|nr:protein-L-isoaspartate(D-aspartate) O-methyltransferase [Ktedonobacteraceae bacterium]